MIVMLVAGLFLVGCGPTAHRPMTSMSPNMSPDTPSSTQEPSPLTREVAYQLSDMFWADPPSCVLVLASQVSPPDTQHPDTQKPRIESSGTPGRMVERAVARHLHQKFDRVIGPDRREALLQEMILDPDHPGDLMRFARMAACRHVVRIAPAGGVAWTPIWTEARVSVALTLSAIGSEEVLWRASHIARRGDGGLPLSPLSMIMAAANATALAADTDLIPSLIEDAVRRTMRTLPDIRRMALVK